MGAQSDGADELSDRKRKYKKISGVSDEDKYKIYFKSGYTRLFLENSSTDYTVYVESKEKEKLGNKNPIKFTQLLTENVKGISSVSRLNAFKFGVHFNKAAEANSFLKLENFLNKNKLRAFIPAHLVEKVGIIRHVPHELSNEEIYKNISCDADVISVKRFMKKDDDKKLVPLTTVVITFSSATLPSMVFLNKYRCPVYNYIPPVIQCFKCFKFNHSAKVCRGTQMCSSCAGEHLYKECTSDIIVCINCGGGHLAISRECPIKKQKIDQKRSQIINQSNTFANIVKTDKNFPSLKPKINNSSSVNNPVNINVPKASVSSSKKDLVSTLTKLNVKQIANNDIILNAIIKSLVKLGNTSNNDDPITHKKIKEIFLSNLI